MSAPTGAPASAAIASVPDAGSHWIGLDNERFLVRPVTPADEPAVIRLLQRASPEEIRFRFFRLIRCFGHSLTAPLVHPDDAGHVGLVAVPANGSGSEVAASAMLVSVDGREAEFALLVQHDYAHHGLGRHLLECLLDGARRRGLQCVYGLVLRDNGAMRQLAREMGAREQADRFEPGCVRVEWGLD